MLELIDVKFARLTFTQERSLKGIHLQINRVTAPTYLVKRMELAVKNYQIWSGKSGNI